MKSQLRKILDRIPVVSWFTAISSKLRIPGLDGMTAYDLWETYSMGIVRGAFSARASAISYSFFMALFPFILFILNLIPFIPIDNFQNEFLSFIADLVPAQAMDQFDTIFKEIALQGNTGLLTISFLSSIFLMTNGVNAVFDGFENSYHVETNRGFFRQYFTALTVALTITILLIIVVATSIYIEYLLGNIDNQFFVTEANEGFWLEMVRNAILIFATYLFISLVYYAGTKDSRQGHFFSAGAFLTTALILLFSYLYGIYIENFSAYNEIYGSIGALLILMVYIWLNSNLLLLGFELNASLRKLKAQNLKERLIENKN